MPESPDRFSTRIAERLLGGLRRLGLASIALSAVGSGGGAAAECRFEEREGTLVLERDCTTERTILLPDGAALDGRGRRITAIDPPGARFEGPVVAARGLEARVRDLVVDMTALAGCPASGDRRIGILLDGARGEVRGSLVRLDREGGCATDAGIEARKPRDGRRRPAEAAVTLVENVVIDRPPFPAATAREPETSLLACPPSCDDGNPCTSDSCDPGTGLCRHRSIPNGSACSDGNSCTTNDRCYHGVCLGGPPAPGCSPCAAAAKIPRGGGLFSGSTAGSSVLAGTCGSSHLSPERVYEWRPATSGTATIETCGIQTLYDTALYVRSGSCTGTQLACNDDGPCPTAHDPAEASRITLPVTAGSTYFIVVDGWGGESGPYSLRVNSPSVCGNGVREGAEACDGTDAGACPSLTCDPTCACAPGPAALPDLVVEILNPFFQLGTSVPPGDVAEGCAAGTTNRDLYRFGVRATNVGNSELFLGEPLCPDPCNAFPGVPCGNPLFVCSPAGGHNHGHYENFALYELLAAGGQNVVSGHKQGFCIHDGFDSGVPCPNRRFNTCDFQGLSVGCADLYEATLGCQYVDITGVPGGSYTLRVTVDPLNQIAELHEANNTASIPVTIAGSNPCDAAIVLPAQGGTFTGRTAGSSALAGSCGTSGASPERVFRWTPAASGTATFRTCGMSTAYDTVLYLRADSCTGPQIGCNDDGPCQTTTSHEEGSLLQVQVTAGRTYFLIVDGYGGQSGDFTLNVIPPGFGASPRPGGSRRRALAQEITRD